MNCASRNGSPQQILLRQLPFANEAKSHSRCRAFWAVSPISEDIWVVKSELTLDSTESLCDDLITAKIDKIKRTLIDICTFFMNLSNNKDKLIQVCYNSNLDNKEIIYVIKFVLGYDFIFCL